jgi:hypothetical protein
MSRPPTPQANYAASAPRVQPHSLRAGLETHAGDVQPRSPTSVVTAKTASRQPCRKRGKISR